MRISPLQRKNPVRFLYVIQCYEAVKIGIALDPVRRLTVLKTANPFDVRLVSTWIGPTEVIVNAEPAVHDRLRHLRIRGEWFYCSPMVAHDAIVNLPAEWFRQLNHIPEIFEGYPQEMRCLIRKKREQLRALAE